MKGEVTAKHLNRRVRRAFAEYAEKTLGLFEGSMPACVSRLAEFLSDDG